MNTINQNLQPIHDTQKELNNLKIKLNNLLDIYKIVAPQIYTDIKKSILNIDQSIQQLNSPTIHLATVGTTSSGKSTLVNAIIGEEIAPVDADEMSAGLLKINHSQYWKLTNFSMNTSFQIYEFLQKQMQEEIKKRKEGKPYTNKNFEVSGPLFPLHPNHEFYHNFGEFIKLDIFDLPGQRTIEDPANTEVIRNYIKKSFTIICIDRQQLFQRETRNKLLDELRNIIEELGGSTSLMYFILNKCDIPNPGGKSVSEHAQEIQIEIKNYLQIDHKIHLIPFSAKVYLFAARLAIAIASNKLDVAQHLIKESMSDGSVRSAAKEFVMKNKPVDTNDPIFNTWKQNYLKFKSIEEKLDLEFNLDKNDYIFFAEALLIGSGHEQFWQSLIQQINQNLSTIIIYPTVNETLSALDLIVQAQKAFIDTQKIQTIQQLDFEIENIQEFKNYSKQQIDDLKYKYRSDFEGLSLSLKNPNSITLYQNSLKEIFPNVNLPQEAPSLYRLHEWTSDLIAKILAPKILDKITMILMGNKKISEWQQEILQEFNFVQEITDLAVSLEQMKDQGYVNLSQNGKKIDVRVVGNEREIENYKKIIRSQANMYLCARRLMAKIAESVFRRKCYAVSDELEELTKHMTSKIWNTVATETENRFGNSIIGTILSKDIKISVDQKFSIPIDVITIPEPSTGQKTNKIEVIGETREKPNASCFKGNTVPVRGEVGYYQATIPSAASINDELTFGVQNARNDFYQRLIEYLSGNHIKKSIDQLEQEMNKLIDIVLQGLETTKLNLKHNANKSIDYWNTVQTDTIQIEYHVKHIKKLSGYGDGRS